MCSKVDELPLARTTEPAAAAVEPPLTVILPAHGWQCIDVAGLWRFHELIFFLAWRDVKVRYKQTLLGAAWAILQPALMTVVFTIGFGSVMNMKAPQGYEGQYPLFVFAALLPWSFFATAVANAGNSVVGSSRLISKVYFPRLAVPFASVGAALVDLVVASGMLVAMMIWYGRGPVWGWQLLLAPAFIALITLLALGVGTLLAALNVFYHDFKYVIPFMVQVWMYATATIYTQPSAASLDTWLHVVLAANPMTSLIGGFRASVFGGDFDWLQIGIAAVIGLGAFLGGCLYFRRVEDSFADLI
jgi:homopolymeric O-antigen transport system permease protein